MRSELERMMPNMKAIDRLVNAVKHRLMLSLADVEGGLEDAEREAEETRRQSKDAKDRFQDLRKKR